MANLHVVEVEVLSDIKNGYRLKISVLDIGLYIFGFTARASDRNVSGWWVQPPASPTGKGDYKQNPEFDKSKSLWPEIEDACVDAVKEHRAHVNGHVFPADKELTAMSIEANLDESIKLFNLPAPEPKKPGNIFDGLS